MERLLLSSGSIMDSNLHSPPPDNDDAKTAFRKPSNDTANRKYRRHSPASGSSSSDGSPKRGCSFSPINKREDPAKVSDHWHRKKDDGKELYRDPGRGQHGRRGDSYRHSDRQSSRGSHSYRRHDDYRHDRYADEEERNYHKLSSRYGRDSIDGTRSDKHDGEHNRSRDYVRNVTKYSRDKYDGVGHKTKDKEMEDQKYKERDASSEKAGSGRRHTNSNDEETKSGERDTHMRDGDGRDEKRGHRGSVEDRKTDRTLYYESRGHRSETDLRKDTSGHHLKEAHKSDSKESDGSKDPKEEKRKYDDWDRNRSKDRCSRESGEQYEDKAVFVAGSQESLAKKHKLSSLGKGTEYADAQETVVKVTPEQARANESESSSDINAAKVAAMKAAELVNRNLVGVGVLSADQKKKLLWGNKKNTAVEQSGHRWDTALFSDRERQEKFNKLMSLRLPWYLLWPIVGCEGGNKSGGKSRKASREREGTSAGFREAIHCWTPTKRWPYCWSRSLNVYFRSSCALATIFSDAIWWCSCVIMIVVILHLWHVRFILHFQKLMLWILLDKFSIQYLCGLMLMKVVKNYYCVSLSQVAFVIFRVYLDELKVLT